VADGATSILFCATIRQKPQIYSPFDQFLLLRWYRDGDGPANLWRLPMDGEFKHRATLTPWTADALLARVDAPFDPPKIAGRDFFWPTIDFVLDSPTEMFHPHVRPAVRQIGGPLIDQILARLDARDASPPTHLKENDMGLTKSEVQRLIDTELTRRGHLHDSPEARQRLHAIESKWAPVAQAFGDSAAGPLAGEGERDYRVRLASKYQKFSKNPKIRDATPSMLHGSIDFVEDAVLTDALHEASHPSAFRPGVLKYVATPDASGRPITRAVGDPNACWDQFNPSIRYVRKLLTPGTSAAS
jgi:hypothetical protein